MKNALWPLLLLAALPLAAQSILCDPAGAELPTVPEISSRDTGVLSGTLFTVSEQVKMPAGSPGSAPKCYPQWVRAYRKTEPNWNPPSSQLSDLMPGPTLRAKVGDVVTLSFINAIDSAKFPNADHDCDSTNVYPGTTGDKPPDCFSGSVFTNVHYHGTHTSPNTTADNVFLVIKPLPRDPGSDNKPRIKVSDIEKQFEPFFDACKKELMPATTPKMYPLEWGDLPKSLKGKLLDWVKDYGLPGWKEADDKLIEKGYWPQYFVGGYPYCFNLPKKTVATATAVSADVQSPHTHGAGSAEVNEAAAPARQLVMGQAPGTHWYHAHKHGSTTINVMNGMTGVFIIEGDYDKALETYYGPDFKKKNEKVLVVQQLGSVPPLVTGSGGDVNFFVNGKFQPVLKMAGNSVQMWRIANTAGRAGAYFLAPQKNTLQWRQLAIDGVQLAPDNYEKRPSEFLIASGNRIDLLVKAPPYDDRGNNKYDVLVYDVVDPSNRPPVRPNANRLTLFTVEVTPNGPDMQLIPKDKLAPMPAFLDDITDREITGTKILTFSTEKIAPNTADSHRIDGKLFNGELGAVVELNRAEEWKIVNETYTRQIAHPFHIHVNPFQITEIFEPNAYFVYGTGTGTASVTDKQDAVVGTNTTFKQDFRDGDVISIDDAQGGVIKAVIDDTHMTLSRKATATISGKYQIVIPRYTIDDATKRNGQCYLDPDPQKSNTWVPCALAGPPEPKERRVWWDVFSIPTGRIFTSGTKTAKIPGYFKMRSRFVDYPGYFVLHCHILAHEDRGMMTVVEVAPLQTPYSHH